MVSHGYPSLGSKILPWGLMKSPDTGAHVGDLGAPFGALMETADDWFLVSSSAVP